MELSGLTALVTGGAAGIGGGIAERLAAESMHVVIADLDDRQGPITAERVGGSFLRTDLADRAGVHAAVDGGGAIINIASTAGLGTASHVSPEYAVAKAGVVRFTACLAPLRDTMAVRANCI